MILLKKGEIKMKKKLLLLGLGIFLIFGATGCKQDNMEDIDIAVTNYPNEYIVDRLYGKHAQINPVYPDGIDISSYKITKKQKQNFSDMELFIYTGLVEKERELAIDLLDKNSDLKIIDTSYVLETEYSTEELWLNPSSLLMMAQNVRLGLKEYITSTYLSKEVDKAYNKLKIELSELDADYRLTVENTDNKVIVVADPALKFLEKFNLKVVCLDSGATEKEIQEVKDLIDEGAISYIFTFKNEKTSQHVEDILKYNSDIKMLELNKLDNITDEDRDEGKDYISLMNENLDTLKQELYQ